VFDAFDGASTSHKVHRKFPFSLIMQSMVKFSIQAHLVQGCTDFAPMDFSQVPDDVEKFGSEAAKWAYGKMLGRWEKLASGLHESKRGVIYHVRKTVRLWHYYALRFCWAQFKEDWQDFRRNNNLPRSFH